MNNNGKLSIEDICDKYSVVLMDTCAIYGPLRKRSYGNSEEICLAKNEIKFCNYLREVSDIKGNIFITKDVKVELLDSLNHFQKEALPSTYHMSRLSKKGCRKLISESLKDRNNSFYKVMRKKNRAKRKLTDSLEESGNILSLKGFALYENIKKDYFWMRKWFGLSDTDFNLVVSGFVRSQYSDSSAIISNDLSGILPAYKKMVKNKKIPFDRFGFFSRINFNEFRQHPNSIHKKI